MPIVRDTQDINTHEIRTVLAFPRWSSVEVEAESPLDEIKDVNRHFVFDYVLRFFRVVI